LAPHFRLGKHTGLQPGNSPILAQLGWGVFLRVLILSEVAVAAESKRHWTQQRPAMPFLTSDNWLLTRDHWLLFETALQCPHRFYVKTCY
jgi:hypothetical protein